MYLLLTFPMVLVTNQLNRKRGKEKGEMGNSCWFCWMVFIFLFLGVNIYRWSQLIRVDLIWCSAVMLLSVSVNGRRVLYLKALRLSNQWSTWSKGFKNYNRMYLTPLYERNIYSPSASCSKVVDGHVCFGLHGCFELNQRLNGFE
jgi:hypothetical protein